jgi:hypothetical protein
MASAAGETNGRVRGLVANHALEIVAGMLENAGQMMSARYYLTLPPESTALQSNSFKDREYQFLDQIITSTGTRKATRPHRLDAINAALFEVLERSPSVPRCIMDIGASTGITTLELLAEFERRGLQVRMIGTDLTTSVYLFKANRFLDALIEDNGHILQLALGGFGFRPWSRRREYFLGISLLRRAVVRYVRSRIEAAGIPIPFGSVSHRGLEAFAFVSPAVRSRQNMIFSDDDILVENRPEMIAVADVVRLANVMQFIYFSKSELTRIAVTVRDRCHGPGSLVVVCRNMDSGLVGSILRLTTERNFIVEARVGGGSEVESFFTELD